MLLIVMLPLSISTGRATSPNAFLSRQSLTSQRVSETALLYQILYGDRRYLPALDEDGTLIGDDDRVLARRSIVQEY
jgi:hypothetical protein